MMLFSSGERDSDSSATLMNEGGKGDERGGMSVCMISFVKGGSSLSSGNIARVAIASLSVPLVHVSHSPSSVSVGLPSLDTAKGF